MEAAMRAKACFLLCLMLAAAGEALATVRVKTETVEYRSGNETIKSFLALPEQPGKYPGIVVIHEWWGLVPWVKGEAEKLAGQGYVALAVDLYRGQTATSPSQAMKLVRALPPARGLQDLGAAFHYLASRPDVERNRIGSIGWCMGGGWSLRLAEHEPRLAACVVNYGELPKDPAVIQSIRAPVLGNFGADDRGIPPAAVEAFETAMKSAGKQINVKIYSGTGHAFENPNNKTGYRPAAAHDAWNRTLAFFNAELK
jgi:carboxymethylenebutenolidase